MERRMSATEARVHFGEVLDSVAKRGDVVFVERSGRPQAVIVSVGDWEQWHRPRENPWERAERIFREVDEELSKYPPGTFANFDVEEAIDAGREERDRAILGDLLP